MYDAQAVFLRDQVPVTDADLVSVDPPIMRLRGKDFSTAYAVVYDGVELTDLRILTRTVLEVALTPALAERPPQELSVLSYSFTSTPNSFIETRLDGVTRPTHGLHRMLQQFLLILFTTPGTVACRPSEGGGLAEVLQRTRPAGGLQQLSVDVATAVSRTVAQMQAIYAVQVVPADERLLSATVASVQEQSALGKVSVRLELFNAAGKTAPVNLAL